MVRTSQLGDRRRQISHLRGGVTLIDLVLAVLIMGVVAAAGGVRYTSALQTYQLRQGAQRIAGDVEAARHAARNRRQAITVQFDMAANSYQVVGLNDADHPAATATVILSDVSPLLRLTSAQFGTGTALRFNEFGNADNGGSVVVSSGGESLSVSVAATTGSVTVP